MVGVKICCECGCSYFLWICCYFVCFCFVCSFLIVFVQCVYVVYYCCRCILFLLLLLYFLFLAPPFLTTYISSPFHYFLSTSTNKTPNLSFIRLFVHRPARRRVLQIVLVKHACGFGSTNARYSRVYHDGQLSGGKYSSFCQINTLWRRDTTFYGHFITSCYTFPSFIKQQ